MARGKDFLGNVISKKGGDINGTHEKRNSNTPYGNLMYDAYNYYAGAGAYSPSATVDAARATLDSPRPTRITDPPRRRRALHRASRHQAGAVQSRDR